VRTRNAAGARPGTSRVEAMLHGQEQLRSALRLALAVAGLLIYFPDPSANPGRHPFALAVLGLFLVYGLVAHVMAARRRKYVPASLAPWIDFAWVTLLVAVSEATSGIFYPLYLFPILNASFNEGFRAGFRIALVSAASYAGIGVLTVPRGLDLDLSAFVTSPLYLLLLGYLTAVWGGYEVRSRARLALLRDVTALSNLRFGVDRTEAHLLEAVRAFYDADACWLVVADERTKQHWARTASRGAAAATERTEIPAELGETLLPAAGAFLADARLRWSGRWIMHLEEGDPEPGERRARGDPGAALRVAEELEAGALLSVPFRYHASAAGRLYAVRRRTRRFDRGELDFLRHLIDQVVPVIENLRLVDRLASDAGMEERRRIARDLHDSTIQPYLALRVGLAAADNAFAAGRADEAASRVRRLLELADGEVETLRGYLRELRGGEGAASGAVLDAGVRRFCSRFSEATGIRVDVVTSGQPVRNDRLAAEVFQMVAEGLSNVRRHTSAGRCEVRIEVTADRLRLAVTNDATGPETSAFYPRSLGERAAALGGTARVERAPPDTTAVYVDIPL
jgi:signal transduction histidine kinase